MDTLFPILNLCMSAEFGNLNLKSSDVFTYSCSVSKIHYIFWGVTHKKVNYQKKLLKKFEKCILLHVTVNGGWVHWRMVFFFNEHHLMYIWEYKCLFVSPIL